MRLLIRTEYNAVCIIKKKRQSTDDTHGPICESLRCPKVSCKHYFGTLHQQEPFLKAFCIIIAMPVGATRSIGHTFCLVLPRESLSELCKCINEIRFPNSSACCSR